MRFFAVIFIFSLMAGAHVSSADSGLPRPRSPLLSPFPSKVPGISIRNTHLIAKREGAVYRGMAPLSLAQAEELLRAGITDVLIFRNDVEGETGIADEEALFAMAEVNGKKLRRIHKEPFQWKDMNGFEEPCRQTVRALRLIRDTLVREDSALFFHCTVGEDRTGYLAGMYRIVFEGADVRKAFLGDMCAHGYAEGDPNKPEKISKTVHDNISRHFVKMLRLVETGKLAKRKLDEEACAQDPAANDPALEARLLKAHEEFRCPVQKIP